MVNEVSDSYARVRRLAILLRRHRIQRNLSQKKLAGRAHLGASTINQLERVAAGGKLAGMPLPDTLRQLAYGLATDGLGAEDPEAARQLYVDFMLEIGYCDGLPPTVVAVPRIVLEKLAELSDAQIELGLTGRPWNDEDIATVLRAIDEAKRRKESKDSA